MTHTDERVEKLRQIIGAINGCEPDGEINILCEKAYVELNTLLDYGAEMKAKGREEGVKAEGERIELLACKVDARKFGATGNEIRALNQKEV